MSTTGQWEKTVEKYRDIFRRHGFHDFGIDFSGVKPEAIEAMAKALEALEAEEPERPDPPDSLEINALRNVRMLAMRIRKKDPENADHLLRLCASVGIVGSVLREET